MLDFEFLGCDLSFDCDDDDDDDDDVNNKFHGFQNVYRAV
jgi:hypothetical protein